MCAGGDRGRGAQFPWDSERGRDTAWGVTGPLPSGLMRLEAGNLRAALWVKFWRTGEQPVYGSCRLPPKQPAGEDMERPAQWDQKPAPNLHPRKETVL